MNFRNRPRNPRHSGAYMPKLDRAVIRDAKRGERQFYEHLALQEYWQEKSTAAKELRELEQEQDELMMLDQEHDNSFYDDDYTGNDRYACYDDDYYPEDDYDLYDDIFDYDPIVDHADYDRNYVSYSVRTNVDSHRHELHQFCIARGFTLQDLKTVLLEEQVEENIYNRTNMRMMRV